MSRLSDRVSGRWVLGGLVLAAIALAGCGDDSAGSEFTPEQILTRQTECYNNALFYDDQGNCYRADPTLLSAEEKTASLVVRPLSTTTTSEGTTDTGGVVPVDPGATTTSAGSSATTTTSGSTATTSGTPTTTTATTTTTVAATTTTTTTAAPPTIASSEWVVRLTPTHEAGVPCSSEPKPPHCADAMNGAYNFRFAVDAGTVSGSANNSRLEKLVVTSGSIAGNGTTSNFKSEIKNTEGVTQSTLAYAGTLTGVCFIEGTYTHTSSEMSGTFTMERNDSGC